TLCRALINGASAHAMYGDFTAHGRCAARALAVAEQLGDPTQLASALVTCGMHAHLTGDWTRAREDLERAVTLSQQLGTSWIRGELVRAMAAFCLDAGAWEEAARFLHEAMTLAEVDRRDAQRMRIQLALLHGRVAAAWELLAPLRNENSAFILMLLAWAHLASGDLAQVAAAAWRARALAEAVPDRPALVRVLVVLADVLSRQRQVGQATRALEE